jgi:hypothetical protein
MEGISNEFRRLVPVLLQAPGGDFARSKFFSNIWTACLHSILLIAILHRSGAFFLHTPLIDHIEHEQT